MATSRYLYNTIDAGCIQGSLSFSVGTTPIILRVIGLTGAQSVPIEMETSGRCATSSGPNCSTEVQHWGPLVRAGCAQALTPLNTEMLFTVPGTYRLNVASLPPAQAVAVNLYEDTDINAARISYVQDISACSTASPSSAPCATPPEPEYDYFQVVRCDAVTGAPVNLLYRSTRPNNVVCPPVAGGVISMVGYISATGAFTAAAAPPAGLGSCNTACSVTAPLGVTGTWG